MHLLTHRYSITEDKTPLPSKLDDPVADEALLEREPWVEGPVKVDYGFNVKLGEGVFINSNCVFIDTCPITVGARTLFGPGVNIYSGTHPLDPALRNGTEGPETGKPVVIGEDCWLAGNVIVLPGITIGKGCTIGAGSVVTKVRICISRRQSLL
jgi:acetyltransferase-like isoleucine patch superfamily enzyme